MKKILTALITLIFGASLTGCAMSNQDAGTITGAVAGGLVGSTVGQGSGQILAIAAGTLAGAYIGNAIGKNMDDNDKMRMTQALESKNVGQPTYWKNAKTGNTYTVTPVKNVKVKGNPYCREYRTTADIGGKQEQIYGTACRQPDGSWKIIK